MENQFVKPVTVARVELIDTLTDIINDSGLPAFIVESILKDMYLEVKTLANKQYEADKIRYEQFISSNQNDDKK